ncbi:MAG: hypothetical protein IKI71_01260, partial [Lachnospiraceae bacterium]|nr:hypothetical protein [Lachnospiraceae bacterium]
MKKILLKNGIVVNSKKCFVSDILIEGEKIKRVAKNIKVPGSQSSPIQIAGASCTSANFDSKVQV